MITLAICYVVTKEIISRDVKKSRKDEKLIKSLRSYLLL